MSFGLVTRQIGQKLPSIEEIADCLRQLFKLYNVLAQAMNDGAISLGTVTVRVVTGVPTATDADGSIAFRIDGGAGTTLYHREASVWVGRA